MKHSVTENWAKYLLLLFLVTLNVTAADLPEVKHPWHDGRLKDPRRERTMLKPLLELSDKQVLELIPARKPFQGRVSMKTQRSEP